MLRITRFRTNRSEGPEVGLRALEVAQQAAEAIGKLDGISWVKVYLGGGALILAGESEDYASADRILRDSECQQAVGRLMVEFGYAVEQDDFLLEPPDVYPFVRT
jgi:hypothetical protein